MDNIDFTKIYSVSKLQLFEQCPRAYHFSYIDEVYSKMKSKLRRDPSNLWPFNTLGKAVHDAITLFLYSPKDQQNLDTLKEQLKLSWKSEAMPQKIPPLENWGGFADLDEEREYYKKALNMLIKFYNTFDKNTQIHYLPTKDILKSIEDYKKLIKPISSDFDISGKFDLIVDVKSIDDDGDSLAVVDFKTSKSEEKNNFQLRFYKLLAELNFKKLVFKASYYYLTSGNIKEYDLSNLDKKEIVKEILAKIKLIKKEKDFKTKPSKLCKYCMFRSFCPAKKEIAPFIKDQDQEDIVEDLPF